MGIYDELKQKIETRIETETETENEHDYGLDFMIFMIVFWPVSVVLGLIDFYLIESYDLRLVNLVLGGLIGWLGVVQYRKWQERRGEAEAEA